MPGGVDVGYGMTLASPSGGSNWTAKIISDVEFTGMTREDVDMTYSGGVAETIGTRQQGYAEFKPSGVLDMGALQFDVLYNPSADGPDLTSGGGNCPITWPEEIWTFTFRKYPGDGTAASFTVLGYLGNVSPRIGLRGRMEASCTLKMSGKPTWTNAT